MTAIKEAQKYFEPILGITSANNDMRFWDKAVDLYQNEKFEDSLVNVLNYLDPNILKKNKQLDSIMIAHGSVVLHLKIEDGRLRIIAPFVKLGDTNQIPLLRQITEINFSVLILSQIQLREDELYFYFESPLDILESYKIYDVLYEICIQADYYDDIFVDDLGAKRIREPEVREFSGRQKKILWERFQEILKECDDYLEYFQAERSYAVGIDSALMTLMKMDYSLVPQGKLRSDIKYAINMGLKKSNMAADEQFEQLVHAIGKLKEYDQDKFLASMYIPNFFISVKTPITLDRVKDTFGIDFNNAQKELAHNRTISAQYFLLYTIYHLLYRYSPPRRIEEMLNQGLKKASGKDWGSSTQTLFQTVKKIMELR